MKEKRPAHRPKRQFPDAKRQLCQPELKLCPHCGERLKSTSTLYNDKDVQTLAGPVNVRAYGYKCDNASCPNPEDRYKAVKELLRVSLPYGTYGLDVIAYIGWQREQKHQQFVEIREKLEEKGIEISKRHVGRLYEQYLALLGGMTEELEATLLETEKKYGGIIWGLDAMQPDKDGTQLYVLYEVMSGEAVAAAWLDKRDTDHLIEWLKPFGELALNVLGTLSDGEGAEEAAMKEVWKDVPHQICHMHVLGNMAKPIRKADDRLKKAMSESLGKLPPVPGDKITAKARPQARTLDLEILPDTKATADKEDTRSDQLDAESDAGETEQDLVSATDVETLAQIQDLEIRFRKGFQDAMSRASRKPSTFGGSIGHEQLSGLVGALQQELPSDDSSYLHILMEQGQRALEETSALAQDIRQARDCLFQVTHLLADPLKTKVDQTNRGQDAPATEQNKTRGELVKRALENKLMQWERQPLMGSVTRSFLTNTRRVLNKRADDLFHCYDIPGLPPSNIDLEALFNRLRRGQRRISGRKQTSELRRTGHFQVLLRATSHAELVEQLRAVPLSRYQEARRRLEAATERLRWKYRLRRSPVKAATAMVTEFLALRRKLSTSMPSGP